MKPLTFKQTIQNDIGSVFLNASEFADLHTINGKTMAAMVDDMEHIEREKRMKSNMDGIYTRQILLYVSGEDYGPLPAFGIIVTMDGKKYTVVDTTDEGGVYTITLEANRSR